MMRRCVLLVVVLALLIGCGGSGDSDDAPSPTRSDADATSTRAVQLEQIATLQAASATATSTAPATTPPQTPTTPATATLAATATTVAATSTATQVPLPTDTVAPTAVPDIMALLPTLDMMPAGFGVLEDLPLDAEGVAVTQADPNAYLDHLERLGFVRAGVRDFGIPAPGFDESLTKMVSFQTLVYEFTEPAGATGYIELNAEIIRNDEGSDMQTVNVEPIGDETLALQGAFTRNDRTSNIAMLYVRDGNILYRFQGRSGGYNSLTDVVALAKEIVD